MRKFVSAAAGAVFALALVVTCGSPSGVVGGDGGGGGDSMLSTDIAGAEAAPGPSCTPYAQFCDGDKLVSCTRSGSDAALLQDCAAVLATAANPEKCYDVCPTGAGGACCAYTSPYCTYSFTSPASASGTLYASYAPSATGYEQCVFTPGCAGTSSLSLILVRNHAACPSNLEETILSIDRSKVAVGQTVTLPSATNAASVTYLTSGTSCSAWTGSVTFGADVPNWNVSINVTCSSAGNSTHVAGTFTGTQ
jgi:hypothetical protein